jgi:hypothetical protein
MTNRLNCVLHLIEDSIARPTPDVQKPAHDMSWASV